MRRRLLAFAASVLLLSGCGFEGIYSLPLPGAEATGEDTYQVTAEFEDVLDLVPYSAVKVQGATVGHVVSIELVDGYAEVLAQLENEVHLPENAVARVAETSLLGEKYLAINPPRDEPAVGTLDDGDVIPLDRTMAGATVEEVLGALSLVLNGGGIDQIRTITLEVNEALTGREDAVRSAVRRLETFVAGLDAQKADIIRALEGVNALSATLAEQDDVLTASLEQLPPAIAVLRDQRAALTEMLVSLGQLGEVGTRVVQASRDDLLANLRDLQPVLTNLATASEDIPKSLDVIATYPFARDVGKYFHGDYGNMWFTINLYAPDVARHLGLTGERTLEEILGGIAPPEAPPGPLPGQPSSQPPAPAIPQLPGVDQIPSLPELLTPRERAPRLPIESDDPVSDIAELLFGVLQ